MKSSSRSVPVTADRHRLLLAVAAAALTVVVLLPTSARSAAAEMAPPAAAPAPAGAQEPAPAQEPSAQEGGQAPSPQAPPEPPKSRDEIDVPEGATSVGISGFGAYIPPRPEVPEPPGGKWLVDEGSERRYFVKRVSKDEQWSWLTEQETHIRVGPSGVYEVESELDDAFQVRVYHPEDGSGWKPEPPPTEEQIAAVAASFRAEVPESDRLRFAAISDGLPRSGQWRNGFDVADMNGDGHLDIVHGPARKGGPGVPVILLGDGAGNWRRWHEARFPVLRYAYGDLRVADFDGDGHLDIALGQHLQGVLAMLGDGKGNFRLANAGLPWDLPGEGGNAGGFSSRALAVADWNSDGRPDVLALGEGPRPARDSGAGVRGLLASDSFGVSIFINELGAGELSWRGYDQGRQYGQVFGDAIAVGDFDGDGRLDFATGSNVFGRRNLVGYGVEGGGWRYAEIDALRPGSYTKALAVADFDGDGRDDLAVSQVSLQARRWWYSLDVLYSRADGWQRRTLEGGEGRWSYASDLGAGDVDGDGAVDLAAVTEDGQTRVYLNDGKGFFTREQSPEIEAMRGGCTGYHVVIADVDGDGRGEVIEAWAGEPSAIFEPDRCPTLGAIRAWDPEPVAPAAPAGAE
jgi:hypothetical protein